MTGDVATAALPSIARQAMCERGENTIQRTETAIVAAQLRLIAGEDSQQRRQIIGRPVLSEIGSANPSLPPVANCR